MHQARDSLHQAGARLVPEGARVRPECSRDAPRAGGRRGAPRAHDPSLIRLTTKPVPRPSWPLSGDTLGLLQFWRYVHED